MTMNIEWLRERLPLSYPFTSNGAIDEDRLRGWIEYQLAGGCVCSFPAAPLAKVPP